MEYQRLDHLTKRPLIRTLLNGRQTIVILQETKLHNLENIINLFMVHMTDSKRY